MYRLRLERMAPDWPELTAGIHMQPIGPGTRQIRVPYLPALRGMPFWVWRQTERPMSRRGVPRCRFALCIVNRINTAVQLPGPLQRRALLLYAAFCWQTNKHASTHARTQSHTRSTLRACTRVSFLAQMPSAENTGHCRSGQQPGRIRPRTG